MAAAGSLVQERLCSLAIHFAARRRARCETCRVQWLQDASETGPRLRPSTEPLAYGPRPAADMQTGLRPIPAPAWGDILNAREGNADSIGREVT